MNSSPTLSPTEFFAKFLQQHTNPTGRPFCWVLGSGASVASGVPMGRQLTTQWLAEMYAMTDQSRLTIHEWATKEFRDVPGFTYDTATNFYPHIYHRRYRNSPDEGISFLDALLEKAANPSFGYKALAQIMAHTKHKVAVTTNFDNLLATSITLFTNKTPLVCGSGSLTGSLLRTVQRPIVAKIHGDLLLSLHEHSRGVNLAEEWKKPLTEIFKIYTPIMIGFGDSGGTGGSLMSFLKQIAPVDGGLFWCYREKSGASPAEEIQSIVKQHNGSLVPVRDFDTTMFQFWDLLKMTSVQHELTEKYEDLVKEYLNDFIRTAESIIALAGPNATDAMRAAAASAKTALDRLREDSA